jgi:hypothetical protein
LDRNLFHIAVSEAGYGLKKLNPLNEVKFFRKEEFNDDDEVFTPLDET